jgi:hypothetical protein
MIERTTNYEAHYINFCSLCLLPHAVLCILLNVCGRVRFDSQLANVTVSRNGLDKQADGPKFHAFQASAEVLNVLPNQVLVPFVGRPTSY